MLGAALLLMLGQAAAGTWTPLRVVLDCEDGGRVGACTFVRGYLSGSPLFLLSPRAEADVRLVVTTTYDANDDLVLLRFVTDHPGWPAAYELVARIDSRGTVDEQRAALEPNFRRGVAVYLGFVAPEAISVSLEVPAEADKAEPKTTPWGVSFWTGGWGSWTPNYQSLSTWGGASVWRTTTRSRFDLWGNGSYDLSHEPSLDIEGHAVSLDTDSWSWSGAGLVERHLNDDWCVGAVLRGGHEDPVGRYLATARGHVGISRDWFPSDDPRGNQLALTALAGVQSDWYNETNALGEDEAIFPTVGLMAQGSVRLDTVTLSLDLSAGTQLPFNRYVVSADADASIELGDHVDLSLYASVTQQAIPGPADLDTSSYEAVTRSNYAEPLSVSGNLNLNVHWDNSNGARNNRFRAAGSLGSLSSL